MKRLYEFTVNKKELVEVEEISTNENGEQVKTIKKTEKEIPYKFFLRKPNRAMNDAAQLFYGVKVAEGIKAGLLTVALLDKRNVDDGGILSSKDNNRQQELWKENLELQKQFTLLQAVAESERTEDQKKELEVLTKKLTDIESELQRLEAFKNSVYENTAEIRAHNWRTTWWLLNIAYQDVAGKEIPFFGEGTLDDKLDKYDELSEKDDDFINLIMFKFLTYTSFWVNNRAAKTEDFDRFEKLINESI